MSRVAISEYKAKIICYLMFGEKYQGFAVNKDNLTTTIKKLNPKKRYVVKVDDGVKKRQMNNLLYKDVKKGQVKLYVNKLIRKGYANILIEKFIPHGQSEEKFIALDRTREGVVIYYSNSGGVNVESKKKSVRNSLFSTAGISKVGKYLNLDKDILEKLVTGFNRYNFSFLESNPFLVRGERIIFLDLAVEVDTAAEFVVGGVWNRDDLIIQNAGLTDAELVVKVLAEKSSASFKLNVLNKNGGIFTILSGGGASIVLADEIYNRGKAKDIVNYAEYSGNPNEEETYIFARSILSLVKKSKAKKKTIYIAGGVANFTDIRTTFRGLVRALEEEKSMLKKQNVKILVRRGGPNQEEGLEMMEDFLKDNKLQGEVYGSDIVLTDVVS